jgi:hypothetical protein
LFLQRVWEASLVSAKPTVKLDWVERAGVVRPRWPRLERDCGWRWARFSSDHRCSGLCKGARRAREQGRRVRQSYRRRHEHGHGHRVGRAVVLTYARGVRGHGQGMFSSASRGRTCGGLLLPLSKHLFGCLNVQILPRIPCKVSSLCQILSLLCESQV